MTTQLLNTALPPELIKDPGDAGAIPTHVSGVANDGVALTTV